MSKTCALWYNLGGGGFMIYTNNTKKNLKDCSCFINVVINFFIMHMKKDGLSHKHPFLKTVQ